MPAAELLNARYQKAQYQRCVSWRQGLRWYRRWRQHRDIPYRVREIHFQPWHKGAEDGWAGDTSLLFHPEVPGMTGLLVTVQPVASRFNHLGD